MSADAVLKKIKKLFALAAEDSGGTEAERNAALEKAQALMLKHGLEMSQVTAQGDDRAVIDVPWDDWEAHSPDTLLDWLLPAVLSGCHCRVYVVPRIGKKLSYKVVGRPENIAYARTVYAFVHPQVEADLARALKARDKRAQYARLYGVMRVYVDEGQNPGESIPQEKIRQAGIDAAEELKTRDALCADIAALCGITQTYATDVSPFVKRGEIAPEIVSNMGPWRRSYVRSCCATVKLRLLESQRRFVEEHGETAQALVVQEDKAVLDFLDTLGLESRGTSTSLNKSGWNAGADAGRNVTIQGGTSLSSQRRQIGA